MIDWQKYQQDPCQTGQSVSKPERAWKESWSWIEFGLTQSQWQRIEEQGKTQISDFINRGQIQELFSYLTGKNDNQLVSDEARLYPLLPDLEERNRLLKDGSAQRRCDILSLRAAFCYALGDKRSDKEQLRQWALLSASWVQKMLPPDYAIPAMPEEIGRLLAFIDQFLMGEKEDGQLGRIALVKGGSFRVKKYLWESITLPSIRGASNLLDEINRRMIPEWVENHAIPESLIYAGGGKCLLLLPAEQGKECADAIEMLYFQNTWTADNAAVWMSVGLDKLRADGYVDTMLELEDRLLQRQMLKLPEIHPPESESTLDGFEKLSGSTKKLCTDCQLRPAQWKQLYRDSTEKDGYFCWSCAHKNREGKKSKVSFRKEVYDYYHHAMPGQNITDSGDILSTEDIAKNIGVIYGDANHMGHAVDLIRSLSVLRAFSMETERVIKRAVYGALFESKAAKTLNQFEVIAIGGDDVILIVPATEAMEIACRIGKRFETAYQGSDQTYEKLTMSVGVTLSSYRLPIRFLFETAQQLLKSAKKKAKAGTKSEKAGTMDVLSLVGDASIGTTMVRQRQNQGMLRKTARPYTWSQARALQDLIRDLREQQLGNRILSLVQAIDRAADPLEAELYYAYLLSRLADRGERASIVALNRVSQTLAGPTWMNLPRSLARSGLLVKDDRTGETVYYSLWHDIAELWEAMGGNDDGTV
jgi:CRISPR-associated protein Cmr2